MYGATTPLAGACSHPVPIAQGRPRSNVYVIRMTAGLRGGAPEPETLARNALARFAAARTLVGGERRSGGRSGHSSNAAAAATHGPEANARWAALDRQVAAASPAIPLSNRRGLLLASDRVANAQMHILLGPLRSRA